MKHSIFQNCLYVYGKVFKESPKMKRMISLNILASLFQPILYTLIGTLVVWSLVHKVEVIHFVLIILGISFLELLVSYLIRYTFEFYSTENSIIRVSSFFYDVLEKEIRTDYDNVEPEEKQLIANKALDALSSNWVGIERTMKSVPPLLINIIGILFYGVIICTVNVFIAVIIITMGIVNILLTNYAKRYEELHKEELRKESMEQRYLYQKCVSAITGKDVRVYKLEKWFYKLFDKLISNKMTFFRKIQSYYLLSKISDSIFLWIRDAIAYYVLVTMVINRQIDIPTFTFMLGIILGFSTFINGLTEELQLLKRASIGVSEYRDLMDIMDHFNHGAGIDITSLNYPLSIEFRNVSFRYHGSDKDTITDLNLTIKSGEKIALVGINGAGKTTIVKLLSGLYAPREGEILVDVHSIKEFNIEDYFLLIGAVFQDINPLSLTILENVSCCTIDKTDLNRFHKVIELAGLKDKIESLPNKENTYLTQILDKGGIQLSGGENQKLMLARALYKDAPVLILDEPTSALDPLSEEELYNKYHELIYGKTSIFISHRLASTKFCDRIIFLENGRIIENGTHHELMSLRGKYAEMFEIQSHYYKNAREDV